MNKESEYYHLKLYKKEFKSTQQTLDIYVFDCSVKNKALLAVERVIKEIFS